MKARVRVSLLFLVAIACSLYYVSPSVSIQRFLSADIIEQNGKLKDSAIPLSERCQQYFQALAKVAPPQSTTSRFLTPGQISNHIDHLRVYGRCFVDNGYSLSLEQLAHIYKQLLPMISHNAPHALFEKEWADPAYADLSYFQKIKQLLKGKGIVVSISERDVDNASRLLHVLYHLQNVLPVQFVHMGDLTAHSQDILIEAGKRTADSLAHLIDITFIDASKSLKEGYGSVFKGYNNKWFAALFNTFQEMILMDADVVPFQDPAGFFLLPGYKETGAYFFRDRELSEALKPSQVEFLKSLIPTEDNPFEFKIDQEKMNNNLFAYNGKHVMESGVVVMDRSTHMSGLITSLSLQYYFVSGRILYGDKDLFWLGQLVSGNSNFHFNEHAAGAIGELEEGTSICSTQLAHFDNSLKLLWTNGGLCKCKKNTWLADYFKYSYLRKKFASIWLLRDSYSAPITVSAAILPASISEINGKEPGEVRGNFNKKYDRGCGGIYYCASLDDNGMVLKFDLLTQVAIKEIIDVWIK